MDPVNIPGNRNARRNQTRRNDRALTDYILVSGNRENDFTSQIINKSREGYIPQGGVSVVIVGGNRLYTQAMVKY